MFEFDHVSAPATNPAALTAQLNERSAEGWEVVTVYTWDHAVVAILRRSGNRANSPAQYVNRAPASTAQPVATPTANAPANWYPDPSGRYELRYWNGEKWTEHVSTGGQQSTDPPVK